MDPITAVSVAAVAVQFADVGARALLRVVKTLRVLKEAPKRLVHLLQDLEHFAALVDHLRPQLEDTNSELYGKLNAQPTSQIEELKKSSSLQMRQCTTFKSPLSRYFEVTVLTGCGLSPGEPFSPSRRRKA